jgi:SAM-dependent methyltransferase
VHDLNRHSHLHFEDGAFDAAGLCVSIQYLTRPVAVLRDVGRVLRPDAPLVITFSNRRIPTKAIAIWRALDDDGHVQRVEGCLRAAGNWTAIERLDRSRRPNEPGAGHPDGAGAYGGTTGDPLFAVVARRTRE